MRYVFRRMHDHVQQIRVALHDINGPRGGVDKQCRLTVDLGGHGFVVITAQANSGVLALDRALKRASQSLMRLWQRRRRPIRGLSASVSLDLNPVT